LTGQKKFGIIIGTERESRVVMKEFFIYKVSDSRMIGRVYAENWVDARLEASRILGYSFKEVFASEKPLQLA
jgi:hypothetical protein